MRRRFQHTPSGITFFTPQTIGQEARRPRHRASTNQVCTCVGEGARGATDRIELAHAKLDPNCRPVCTHPRERELDTLGRPHVCDLDRGGHGRDSHGESTRSVTPLGKLAAHDPSWLARTLTNMQ